MTNTLRPEQVVDQWLNDLSSPCTFENVRHGFWYVRLPGEKRKWIPLELELGSRSLKVTSHVIPEPIENREEVYRFLLRHNMAAQGIAFGFDGEEGVLCLVGRIPVASLTPAALDAIAGRIVETTELTFRSILRLGYASLLRR